MKDKNRTSKFVTNTIISGIVGAFIGIIITTLVDNITFVVTNLPSWVILVVAFFVFCSMAMIFLRIDNYEEYQTEVMKNMSNPLIRINNDVISDFATSLVKKSKYIRVVGVAKQDILDDEDRKAASKRYLSKLEDMLSKNYESEMGFQYYRVIPKSCNEILKNHIEKCRENCRTHKKNKFQVLTANNDFDFYISYQIFDQSDLLIIVDNPTVKDPNKDDNALCYWTRDPDTIKIFTKRFDSAWDRACK